MSDIATTPVKANLIAADPDGNRWEALGTHSFTVLPRLGDLIDKEIGGVTCSLEVVAFFHPSSPIATSGDLLVINRGESHLVRKEIYNSAVIGGARWRR